MPNSTPEYWDANGISLQTFAQNLSSWGGGREGVPPLRGEDLKIPYLPGRRFARKVPDSRIIPLEGWVVGTETINGRERGTVQAARKNWRALRSLLWDPRKQISLTRRWYDANGVLQTATALAQFAGGMEPDVEAGGTKLKFAVDLFLADPFFYGAEITHTLVSGTQTKQILGDWPSLRGRLELVGVQGPTTVATTGEYAHSVTYGASVLTGTTAILDVEAFKATVGSTPKTENVSHSGARFWFSPDPGAATSIVVTRTGTGTLRYVYRPAWF